MLDGRADLAVHSAKDLPVGRPSTGWCWRPCPSGATPATRSSARTLDELPPGRRRGHRVGAAPGPAGRPAARPHLRRPARQHGDPAREGGRLRRHRRRRRRPRAARAGPTAIAEVLDAVGRAAPGRPGRARRRVPGRRRRHRERCSAAIEHGPSRRAVDAERGFLAELGGDCDLPAGAYAVVGRRRHGHASTACSPPSTATSCSAHARSAASRPGAAAARWLLANGGEALLDG